MPEPGMKNHQTHPTDGVNPLLSGYIYSLCTYMHIYNICTDTYKAMSRFSKMCVQKPGIKLGKVKIYPHSPIFGECCESQNATSAAHNPHLVKIRSSIYKYCHYFVKTWYMKVWSTLIIIIIIRNPYSWTCLDVDFHPTKTRLFTSTKLWNSEESQNKSFDSVNRSSIKLVQIPLKEMQNKSRYIWKGDCRQECRGASHLQHSLKFKTVNHWRK